MNKTSQVSSIFRKSHFLVRAFIIISQSIALLLSPAIFIAPAIEARGIFQDFTSWNEDSFYSPESSQVQFQPQPANNDEVIQNDSNLLFTDLDHNFEADDPDIYDEAWLNQGGGGGQGSNPGSTKRPPRQTLPVHLGGFSYFPPVSDVGSVGKGSVKYANKPSNPALEKLRLLWRRIFRRRTSNDEDALCHFKLCMPSRSSVRL